MPDQQTPAPNGAPPPATPPANAAPPATDDQNPAWLPNRLAREREAAHRQVLAELGITDPKDGRAALDAYKKLQESQKTEEQRLREAAARVQPLEAENATLKAAVATQASDALSGLTDVQKAAVLAIAGDDPARQIQTISNLRKSGMLGAAPASSSSPAAPPPPQVPPPASTTNAPAAPPQGNLSPPNHLAVWQDLQKKNPIQAAQYRLRYDAEISALSKKT